MEARGSPLARLGSLPIRAPLSSEGYEDDDDDGSGGTSAYGDEEDIGSGSGTEPDTWTPPVARPIAQLTGDDEYDSSESFETASDEEFAARVAVLAVKGFFDANGRELGTEGNVVGVLDGRSLIFGEGGVVEVENSLPKSPKGVSGNEDRILDEDSKDGVLGIGEKDEVLTGNHVTQENSEAGILGLKEKDAQEQEEHWGVGSQGATDYSAPNQSIEAGLNRNVDSEHGAEKARDEAKPVSGDSEAKHDELRAMAALKNDGLSFRSTEDVADRVVKPTNSNSQMADMNVEENDEVLSGNHVIEENSEVGILSFKENAPGKEEHWLNGPQGGETSYSGPNQSIEADSNHSVESEHRAGRVTDESNLACVDPVVKHDELGSIAILEDDVLGSRSTGDVTDQGVKPTDSNSYIADMEGRLDGQINSINGCSRDCSETIDGNILMDSHKDVGIGEEGIENEFIDSAALAKVMEGTTTASSDVMISTTSPAGLGSSTLPRKRSSPHSSRLVVSSATEVQMVAGETELDMDEEKKKLHCKVEEMKVKFIRLVHRLGLSPEDGVAAKSLYHLSLLEGISHGRDPSHNFGLEKAKKTALQLEMDGKEDIDFACNILVMGKTGVGKSAIINSIFSEEKSQTNAFRRTTSSLKVITGSVDGVKLHVIDTPGFEASIMDQASNRKILSAIKKYIKRCPPDVILYVDRLDTHIRDSNDLPLLRTISSVLDSSIWSNAVVALTHASSAPPEGPLGLTLSYNEFIAQRSYMIQFNIHQSASNMHLINPVALVENHPCCRRNREGQKVLPNGQRWRTELLLLCYSIKILSEASLLLKLQDPYPGKLLGRYRSSPLPFFLTSLLQSRPHPKLSSNQDGENGDSDLELDGDFELDQGEEEDDYDRLPLFTPLRKSEISKLTKEQKKAYFDEYDYRVKLFQKKQWKENLRRLKDMKKRKESGEHNLSNDGGTEDCNQENAPVSSSVPLPDIVLPPSFDSDYPGYRYRFLEPTSQLMFRPVLNSHGWDHDSGFEGVSLEENLAIAGMFPAVYSLQITKNKKEFNVHLDSSVCLKHGQSGSTLAGLDIQAIGRQLAYIFCCETRFKNLKNNKTTAGINVILAGETLASGLKIEDQISVGKRMRLVTTGGAFRAQGDMAYGANLEVQIREGGYPIGQLISTCSLSLMKWRSELALGTNFQSEFSTGRNSKMAIRVGLNSKMSGQITVRTSASEQLQMALVGAIPIAISIFDRIWHRESLHK